MRDKYICRVCHKRCDYQRRMVEFIEKSTKASGVPYYVEDPEAIRTVAILLGVKNA